MEKLNEDYSIDEHIHRYACWTAARAASVSRFSNNEICQFIEETGLRKELQHLRTQTITSEDYKNWFRRQVNDILHRMEAYVPGKEKPFFRRYSFGIAAKVVSIYVKTSEVIPSGGASSISKVAIPPIDSYLLKGLNIKGEAWSTLEEEKYMALINDLEEMNQGQPFWKLEFYWNLNNQGNA